MPMNGRNTGVLTESRVDTLGLEDAMQRGIAASSSGDKEGAHSLFRRAAEQYPNAPQVWVWIGWTSPNLDEARAAFEHAQSLDPSTQEAALGLRWVESQGATS